MGVKGGPDIETDGLVFHLDAAATNIGKGYSTQGLRVEYLVVAGGGGGSGWGDGVGGGAGGFLSGETRLVAGTYTVTVGAGGNRGTNSSASRGSNGGDSQLGSIVAYGGGGAGCKSTQDGLAGGSGGGGYGNNNVPHGVGGSGVAGQGYDGGDGINYYRGGGGGGAGAPGTPGTSAPSNGLSKVPGGIGKVAKIDFVWQYYAGGGGVGGCCGRGDGSGGLGGGGSGGDTNTDGIAGTVNTGGGGGGGGTYFNRATYGGNGGSGIVMIRYWGKQKATGGDTIQYKNGYTIHTFTSSGSFVLSESIDGTSSNKIVGTLTNMGSSSFKTNNKGYWSFDGSNQYIQIDKTAGQLGISSSGGKFSIDIWFRNTGDGTSSRELFGTFRGYLADIDIYALSNYRFYVSVQDNNGDRAAVTSDNDTCPINQWVYGVLVWDGTTKTISSYLNGQFIGSNTNALVDNIFEYANDPIKFRIGASSVPNWTYGPPPFEGDIASIKIYDNIALSETQILNNYNATKGRFGL